MYWTQLTDACGSLSHDHELSLMFQRLSPLLYSLLRDCATTLSQLLPPVRLQFCYELLVTKVLLGVELTFPSRHLYNLCG